MSFTLIGKKVGMSQIFDEKGNSAPCSIISIEPNFVVQVKTKEKDGYSSVQIGGIKISNSNKKNVSKPLKGHFNKAKVELTKVLLESPCEESAFEIGAEIGIDVFLKSSFVDVIGKSKGKGFQGVIKRHNFSGGPGGHGSKFHRHGGSIGMRSTPGICFSGVKMPGHMGDERTTVENLQIIKVDVEKKTMTVKGAVPGCIGTVLYIRESEKKKAKK